jgi:hypothetical protein
MEIIKINP